MLDDLLKLNNESDVEEYLKNNDTLVNHEEYCDIVNSFFFHDFDITVFFKYRRSLTFSNKISYTLYKPKNINVSADVDRLNANYDILLKYNIVLSTADLIEGWDIQPNLFEFISHLIENKPEISPNFSEWLLNTSYKHEVIQFLKLKNIKLNYYSVNTMKFKKLDRLSVEDCRIFLSMLDNPDFYTPYLTNLSNFAKALKLNESSRVDYKIYNSNEWIFDDKFIRIYNDFKSDRCIGSHLTNMQFRLKNIMTNEMIPVCSLCINSIKNNNFITKKNELVTYYNCSNILLDKRNLDDSIKQNINFFKDNSRYFSELMEADEFNKFDYMLNYNQRSEEDDIFLFHKMNEIISLCKRIVQRYSL